MALTVGKVVANNSSELRRILASSKKMIESTTPIDFFRTAKKELSNKEYKRLLAEDIGDVFVAKNTGLGPTERLNKCLLEVSENPHIEYNVKNWSELMNALIKDNSYNLTKKSTMKDLLYELLKNS